jgi:uncharacterized protein (DUF1330 family)/anti-sigma regulatory factor (Ser/Thr protein kinase)
MSRQGVHRRLRCLADAALVRPFGQGRGARWELLVNRWHRWPLDGTLEEDRLWDEVAASLPELESMTDESRWCLAYGMLEMLNNAIEHSAGAEVAVTVRKVGLRLVFAVSDDGVGALRTVRDHFGLDTDADALLRISKGRQTTAPAGHSGQGIFFTSKVVDSFALRCQGLTWLVDNVRNDQSVAPGTGRPGTIVELTVDPRSTRRVREVFDAYADVDAPNLQRSTVRVQLADSGGEFLSRSEARRLSGQLDQFSEVVLDFDGVASVGQAFVDELFRVFARQAPDTVLVPVHMSEEVEFMVRRGLPPLGG